jgi:hypothetical protein
MTAMQKMARAFAECWVRVKDLVRGRVRIRFRVRVRVRVRIRVRVRVRESGNTKR